MRLQYYRPTGVTKRKQTTFGAHIFLWTDRWSDDSLSLIDRVRNLGLDCLDISVELSLRSRLYALAHSQGSYCISAPVLGFGTLVVIASPDGAPMDAFLRLLERVNRTHTLPHVFRQYFAALSIDAIERDIASGKVPSLAMGPCLAGALVSTEAMLCLLPKGSARLREPLCLPRVLAMDALAMSYRILDFQELSA